MVSWWDGGFYFGLVIFFWRDHILIGVSRYNHRNDKLNPRLVAEQSKLVVLNKLLL